MSKNTRYVLWMLVGFALLSQSRVVSLYSVINAYPIEETEKPTP